MPSIIDALKGKTLHFSKVIIPSLSRLVNERKKYQVQQQRVMYIIYKELSECIGDYLYEIYHFKTKTSLNKYVKNINPRNAEFLTVSLSNIMMIRLIDVFEKALDFNDPEAERFVESVEFQYTTLMKDHESAKYDEFWDFYQVNKNDASATFKYWYEFYWNEILGLPPKNHVLNEEASMYSEDLAMLLIAFNYLSDRFITNVAEQIDI